jgi:PAS domain-containing protein
LNEIVLKINYAGFATATAWMIMPLDRNITEILCASNVQKLHLFMEQLPIGLIIVDQNASIVSVDEFSERVLNFEDRSVKGRSITEIFGDAAKSWLSRMSSIEETAYLGCLHLITSAGLNLRMEIAMAPSIVPHQKALHVVFAVEA